MPQPKSKTTKKPTAREPDMTNCVTYLDMPPHEIYGEKAYKEWEKGREARLKAFTDPWAALDAIVGATVEPTGPEWFTVVEFGKRYGIQRPAARERLVKLTTEGKLEQWKGLSTANKRTVTKWRVKAR